MEKRMIGIRQLLAVPRLEYFRCTRKADFIFISKPKFGKFV